MRRTSKSFLILFGAILLVMSFSLTTSERLRGMTIRVFSPIWEIFSPLQIRDKQLHPEGMTYKDPFKNEKPNIKAPTAEAIPARIIFRSPSTWNSSFWINVGKEANKGLSQPILAKNSPVLVGDSVVGVVDYVGSYQSRVRLITDSGLVPSVRVARGDEQTKVIAENISDLLSYLSTHPELVDQAGKMALENGLRNLQQKLIEKKHTWYLAKGEIQGQSHPLWRTDGQILKGSGFNYDFEDEYGPSRDLRTGEPLGSKKEFKAMSLVKVHDLLITTGMDGVFPPGLKVAYITKVHLLREGDFAFEVDAKPTVGNLEDLSWVYVIAPLGYDEKDQPSLY